MKKILFTLFVAGVTFANALNLGDATPTFKIKDQFEKVQTIKADTKTILVAADKDMSEVLRDYLLTKPKGFLEENKAYYVADISGMPSLIAKFFALPKMKKYPFSILLLDDTNKEKFTKKDGTITVYTLNNGKITNKKFISKTKDLDSVFN